MEDFIQVAEPPIMFSVIRVLVVDDNRDAADSLFQRLDLLGNNVQTAYDGEEGVATAEDFRPDVILMDIGMPKLDGHEAAKRIRGQPWGIAMLLIAVTDWRQHNDRRKSAAAGFDAHLTKPVDTDELLSLMVHLRPFP